MKHYLKPVLALLALSFLSTASVLAGSEEKMVIALKTDHFELAETDVSSMFIGESQTIETDSGKIIDILRTTDGVELYVDGELQDIDLNHEGMHEEHMVLKHVEVICDDSQECDEDLFELNNMHRNGEHHKIVVIEKEVTTKD